MSHGPTRRQKLVLAALSAGTAESFAPVQVQKMFFLLDENISAEFGGKQFDFEPYDYGPFDKSVYSEIDALISLGLVELYYVSPTPGGRRYSLSGSGRLTGQEVLQSFSPGSQQFIIEVADWVRKLNFAQLVGSIYKAFPHMREKSIFVE